MALQDNVQHMCSTGKLNGFRLWKTFPPFPLWMYHRQHAQYWSIPSLKSLRNTRSQNHGVFNTWICHRIMEFLILEFATVAAQLWSVHRKTLLLWGAATKAWHLLRRNTEGITIFTHTVLRSTAASTPNRTIVIYVLTPCCSVWIYLNLIPLKLRHKIPGTKWRNTICKYSNVLIS